MKLPIRPEFAGQEPYGAPQLDVPVVLNTNENPYPPTPEVVEAIAASAAAAAERLNRYPDREFMALRAALADYLKAEAGVVLAPEQVWAANGSNEVMLQLLQTFAGPGRKVLTFTPSYSMYPEYARNVYAQFIAGQRTADFRIDMDDAERLLAQHQPAALLLASPNNPTGTAVDPQELRVLARLTQTSGPDGAATVFIVDEAYGEFRREGVPSALELLEEFEHVVVTRTMSKAFGAAGLRLGYMAASQQIVDAVRVVRLPYHLSALSQAAALAALENRESLMAQVAQIRKDRDLTARTLTELGFQVAPSDANFIMFGTFTSRHDVWQALLDRGVLIREVGPEGWLRVSVGTPEENAAFIAALKEVA